MARENNIDILVEGQFHLDYESPESLGLKLSRKVDDANNLSKRFGDFSYSFSVPQTKTNNVIFNHANVDGRQQIFVGQKFNAAIYNNKKILINGILELVGITETTYEVVMHSLLNQFIDACGTMELKDISTFEPVEFNYEQTIVDHLNYNGTPNSDVHLYEFPFIFYNTVYCPYSVYSGKTGLSKDNRGVYLPVTAEDSVDNHYYAFNSVATNRFNEFYYHQFPPSLYLVRIIEGIFNTVGWQVGGSWLQRDEIKKIIVSFVGESDIYDQALVTGATPTLRPELFLAKGIKMVEFLSAVFNTFNLYFIIDTENKNVILEDWNTMFNTQENPFILDGLINETTVKLEKPENGNPSIKFKDMKTNDANDSEKGEYVLGDNNVIKTNSDSATVITWQNVSNKNFNQVFNKLGTDDDIDVAFGTPRVKRMLIYNDYDLQGNLDTYGVQTVFIPAITKSNPQENNNKPFNKNSGHTVVYNTEDTIQYAGVMSLYYYYGQPNSDVVNKQGKNVCSDYMYLNIATGNSYTRMRTKIGIASPFMLSSYRNTINTYLNTMNSNSIYERDIITCSYLQGLYTMFKRTDLNYPQTPYSLVFDDDNTYHETLYTYYHQNKYNRYQNSNLLTADLVMDENVYDALQINRPILYRGEMYHMITLTFNPITKAGTITIIKDLQ